VFDYISECRKTNADSKIISGILDNLISNAIKYSPCGGEIILRVITSEDQIRFEIIDEGIGIESGDLAHLFEPFYRGKNVSNIKGSGLGLSIVQRLASLHGGNVSVKSQLGKGSVFTVLLKTSTSS
jgi:signal transduction histidine kinase